MTHEEWREYCEPLRWQGRYVYVIELGHIGFVMGSHQTSGRPESNTIKVATVENGRRDDRFTTVYTMDQARKHLVPDITYLVVEEPEVSDDE